MTTIDTMSKEFAEKQFETILSLEKKIKQLEKEKASLEKMLASSGPLLVDGATYNLEENIARVQLAKLNGTSLERELTLEECKKVEIYTKILNLKGKPARDVLAEVKKLSDSELLTQLENGN